MDRRIHHEHAVDAKVRHPLWPELGTGVVLKVNSTTVPACRTGIVRWSTGQESSHHLGTLRAVTQ